jgi:hypothetical protein
MAKRNNSKARRAPTILDTDVELPNIAKIKARYHRNNAEIARHKLGRSK